LNKIRIATSGVSVGRRWNISEYLEVKYPGTFLNISEQEKLQQNTILKNPIVRKQKDIEYTNKHIKDLLNIELTKKSD